MQQHGSKYFAKTYPWPKGRGQKAKSFFSESCLVVLWIFYVFVLSCVCYVLCASVSMCFVVTCWERADLLALVCGVFCEFVTFPLVSWVRCGTWLYRFLIFAPLLTFVAYPIKRKLSIEHHESKYSVLTHILVSWDGVKKSFFLFWK